MGNDRDYFMVRAEEEEARAAKCEGEAQDAHRRLAQYYREAAANRGPRPLTDEPAGSTLTIIGDAAGKARWPRGH